MALGGAPPATGGAAPVSRDEPAEADAITAVAVGQLTTQDLQSNGASINGNREQNSQYTLSSSFFDPTVRALCAVLR